MARDTTTLTRKQVAEERLADWEFLVGVIEARYETGGFATGLDYTPHPGGKVVERMVELGRPSRLKGAGFYEYDESGKRQGLWPDLGQEFPTAEQPPEEDPAEAYFRRSA